MPSQRGPDSVYRGSMFLLLVGVWTLGFGLWTSSAAQNTNSATNRTDYRNFEVIAKKNIFNPRRSPAYVPSQTPTRVAPRTETLALVGVMSYGKGPMAFFEGNRSDYRKVLKPNDNIAGFKVTSIDSSSVKLADSTNELELQVGMQLAREDQGDWKISTRPESLESAYHETAMRSASSINAERASAASTQSNPFGNLFANGFPGGGGPPGGNFPGAFNQTPTQPQPTQSTQPTISSDPGDVLRRMALRRQQETGESEPQSNRGQDPAGQNQPVPIQQDVLRPLSPNVQAVPQTDRGDATTPDQQPQGQPNQNGELSPAQDAQSLPSQQSETPNP